MKLSDYVFEFLKSIGIKYVFGILGGANSHLADSISKTAGIDLICTQHEQGAAMAAEGYARAKNGTGAVLVTSGPGGTNTLTGLCCCWCDSVPCIFISGQVPLKLITDGNGIRQLGVQQINIIAGVKPYTKYAVMVTNPKEIRYHLEKAAYIANSGRPGPVWLDLPTEIQRAEIDPDKLERFKIPFDENQKVVLLKESIDSTIQLIKKSKRPVLIAGNGIRLANAENEFRSLAGILNFPIITTWNGIDLFPHDHPNYIGCAGTKGQRGSNFTIANSDLILSIGSRLDTRQVGTNPELYARAAKKIVVDIDHYELSKGLINIDLPICADAKIFIQEMLSSMLSNNDYDFSSWLAQCRLWKEKYPVVPREYFESEDKINSYVFIDELCKELHKTLLIDDIIVTDMGTSLTCTMQTVTIKQGQRLLTNTGFAPMGFGLPAAIGAWFASEGKKRIIGIFGDGGFQMNIQELQTVKHNNIPIKIFILNNLGYLTIKHTQESFFDSNYVGSEPGSGYSTPNFSEIAKAYGIKSLKMHCLFEQENKVKTVLDYNDGPILCEIMMDPDQELIPGSLLDKSKNYSGSPIERMHPPLPEKEFRENMLIEPI